MGMCALIPMFSVAVRENATALPDYPCSLLQFHYIWTQCAVMFPHGKITVLHEVVAQALVP